MGPRGSKGQLVPLDHGGTLSVVELPGGDILWMHHDGPDDVQHTRLSPADARVAILQLRRALRKAERARRVA
jgi:hypothetical protein